MSTVKTGDSKRSSVAILAQVRTTCDLLGALGAEPRVGGLESSVATSAQALSARFCLARGQQLLGVQPLLGDSSLSIGNYVAARIVACQHEQWAQQWR